MALLRPLLFPPRCVSCRTLLPLSDGGDTVFCPFCRTGWETAMAEAASQASRDASRGLVYLTFYRPHRPDGVPERLIYHLKHKGSPAAFAFAASRLAPRVKRAVESLPTRVFDGETDPETAPAPTSAPHGEVPLPILFTYPPRRFSAVCENGFDQAKRLSKALAKACGGEFTPLIRRVRRPARAQKSLAADRRTRNADRAYALNSNRAQSLRGRTVVVCDDLRTTGATLNRCAELLVEAGAGRVVWVTVARTRKNREE